MKDNCSSKDAVDLGISGVKPQSVKLLVAVNEHLNNPDIVNGFQHAGFYLQFCDCCKIL